MYRAVLDTNVFVSGTTISTTPPAQILNLWRNGEFILVISPELLKEAREVLKRPEVMKYTKASLKEVDEFINEVKERAFVTQGIYGVDKITVDPDDNIVLACALEGYATHIVTGDTKSLLLLKQYQDILIVQPAHFLNLLKSK